MIGCEDSAQIASKIVSLSRRIKKPCSCKECAAKEVEPIQVSSAPVVLANKELKAEMDKAGYFVIIPQLNKKTVVAEHYSYGNKLLRAIEGKDAQSIYSTIIQNGWVTQLSHAAYLGKELAKAEFSLKFGSKYTQDLGASFQHPK